MIGRKVQKERIEGQKQQLGEPLANGRVEDSQSRWSSPVVLVKRHYGSNGMCIDYRKLNLCTSKDAIPLARTDDILRERER